MRTIQANDLKRLLDQNQDLILVNVLSRKEFEKDHIPGSHNIPKDEKDFVQQVEKLAGTKDRHIVVYCASKDCQASPTAAKKLTDAGFRNVTDFEGGMAEWKKA
ncbi:MAG: rhodanese-like domain-containing protein, partial [Gemmatimonadales bacterium]